jgi:hypothetical protein
VVCDQALTRYVTDAMRESRVLEFLHAVRVRRCDPKQKDYTVMLIISVCGGIDSV